MELIRLMDWNLSELHAILMEVFLLIFFFFNFFRWVQTGSFQVNYHVTALSWNVEGNRLLIGGKLLQIWKEKNVMDEEDENPARMFHSFYR